MPKTYTVKQFAGILGVSTNTVYKYLDEEKIKASRLGDEGRFRIPESELTKFIGSPITPTVPPTPDNLDAKDNSDLNDWFLGLTAVFLSFILIIYPNQIISLAGPLTFFLYPAAKYLLLFSGLIFICFSITQPHLFRFKRMFAALLNSLILFVICFSFFAAGDPITAGYFLALGLAFISLFLFRPQTGVTAKLLLSLGLVSCFPVLSRAIFTQPGAIISSPLYAFASRQPLAFSLLTIGFICFIITLIHYSKSRFPGTHLVLCLMSGITSLGFSLLFLNLQWWPATIIHLLTGYYLIILPFEKQLSEGIFTFSKRQSLISLGWLTLIFSAGFTVTLINQQVFAAYLFSQSADIAQSAKNLSENLIKISSKTISLYSADPELIQLFKNNLMDIDKFIAKAKSFYFSGGNIQHLTITDINGRVLGVYPPPPAYDPSLINLANLPSFRLAAGENRTVISDNPLMITSPISSQGVVLGLISGQVSLENLQNQILSLDTRHTSRILIANSQGQIFIHPQPELTDPVMPETILYLALSGQSGQITGLTSDNKYALQSFTFSPTPGWGIVIQQDYKEIFKDSYLLSFFIFNVIICFGIGALIIPDILIKRKPI